MSSGRAEFDKWRARLRKFALMRKFMGKRIDIRSKWSGMECSNKGAIATFTATVAKQQISNIKHFNLLTI